MNRVSQSAVVGIASLLVAWTGFAKPDADASLEPPVLLPSIMVRSERLHPEWLVPHQVLTQPDFRGVPAELVFPVSARHEGFFEGRAVVGVMLDREGRAVDFLILKYSKRCFADELLTSVAQETFTPRRIRGVAVPGRFNLAQRFYLSGRVAMTPLDAIAEFTRRVTYRIDGGAPYESQPCMESATDGNALRFTESSTLTLPNGFVLPAGDPVKVVVSFYVDATGRARLPNVESDTAPDLIEAVVTAVSKWRFAPPTVKGRPVLVLAIRSIEIGARAPAQNKPAAESPAT